MTTDNKRVEETQRGKQNCNHRGDDGCVNRLSGWNVNGKWYCSNHWSFEPKSYIDYLLAEVERLETSLRLYVDLKHGQETKANELYESSMQLLQERDAALALLAEKDAEIERLMPKDNRCPFHPWMSAIEELP